MISALTGWLVLGWWGRRRAVVIGAVRFFLELGALAAIGHWAWSVGNTTATKCLLSLGSVRDHRRLEQSPQLHARLTAAQPSRSSVSIAPAASPSVATYDRSRCGS